MNRLDTCNVAVVGAGLAGSEAALSISNLGCQVTLIEMRSFKPTLVHKTDKAAELVCSNSLKSLKAASAAGMLKQELLALGSQLLPLAFEAQVPAGGALAVDRDVFSQLVEDKIKATSRITRISAELSSLTVDAQLVLLDQELRESCVGPFDAIVLATGPLTSDVLAQFLVESTGVDALAFYDAAAPIVMADSLDYDKLFTQSRYEEEGQGDYLNAPFTREEYESFISELVQAERVIAKDFETKELFNACQPIEEIARKGLDAPRFGPLKPVGLTDPRTGRRPWAALQLRAEDVHRASFNLVGFQTNLKFSEQSRIFRMIPGLEQAEFVRFGVMHRNTFLCAPALLDTHGRLKDSKLSKISCPVYVAGQLAGTEGYTEAIASGRWVALSLAAELQGVALPKLPLHTAFGALMDYVATSEPEHYQPMHVNFGIMEPLPEKIKNKKLRYAKYAERGLHALSDWLEASLSYCVLDEAQARTAIERSLSQLSQEECS